MEHGEALAGEAAGLEFRSDGADIAQRAACANAIEGFFFGAGLDGGGDDVGLVAGLDPRGEVVVNIAP